MAEKRRIKVLVVDDSAVVRATMTAVLSASPDIEVIGVAADPFIAADKIRDQLPDVITLDVDMPRMDGITFLQKIMSQHPIPVVVCSALTQEGAQTTMRAFEYGAVEVIAKPQLGTKRFLEESSARIQDAVRAAASARLDLLGHSVRKPAGPKHSADAVIPKRRARVTERASEKVVAVGASTGGTEAIRTLLASMPADGPAILVVQHMPREFTRHFADRLDNICEMQVKEADEGDMVAPGRALIAPGDRHMALRRTGDAYRVELLDGPLVCRHRPSVDVLFRSVAQVAGRNSIGVLLTGMGDDGAAGLLEMREAGARTIAQDEATSVVFGMPAEAIRLSAAESVLGLPLIAEHVLEVWARNPGRTHNS